MRLGVILIIINPWQWLCLRLSGGKLRLSWPSLDMLTAPSVHKPGWIDHNIEPSSFTRTRISLRQQFIGLLFTV